MLTLEIPFDGLGGQAGLPNFIEQAQKTYRSTSELLYETDRLPTEAIDRLDGCVRTGLALHPDGRFGTRSDWLAAWDGLHDSLKKGNRLTRWEKLLLRGFDSWGQLFSRKKT